MKAIKTFLYILFLSLFFYVIPLVFTKINPSQTKPYLISSITLILLNAILPEK